MLMAQMRAVCLIQYECYLLKIAALSNIKSTCLKSLISYPIYYSNSRTIYSSSSMLMAQMRAVCLIQYECYLLKIAALSNIKSTCLKSLISYPIYYSNSAVSIR